MTINVKLTKPLYDQIIADLQRPHDVAYERVGFATARIGTISEDEKLLLITGYQPVAEGDYLQDHKAGAHIGSSAISAVMQKILDDKVGVFHVHIHPFPGKPGLSRTDMSGILPLIPSFKAVGPQLAHGVLLFSLDNAIAYVWVPESMQPIKARKISIIGRPLQNL
jgi:hypothetical protein